MGNTRWGLGIRLVFMICVFSMTASQKWLGGGNQTAPSCSEKERLALLKFKRSIKDDHGMLSSWGVGNDCCSWERVGCDDATGRVVSLQLRKLVNLKHLDLSGNDFQQSQIPEFIGSFRQLRYLNLSDAGFTGNIPHQIGNLSNLKVLDLGTPQEYLLSHDMSWISGLPKLEHLDLSGVDLSRTQNLDNLLYMIPSLLKVSLSRCGLSVAHLGSHHLNTSRDLASIRHLDLSGNGFRGQLPGLFLNMTSLAFLDLSENDVSMAWSFGNLLNMIPSLLDMRLSRCGLQKVNLSPANLNFSTHSSMQHLDLSRNEIEGGFPYVLANMSSLMSLDISWNILNSSVPVMPNLLKLDISYNKFRQIEDVGIWRQCHLKELIVSHNYLEGEMISPSTNASKCSQYALEILYLDRNALNSSIPESLGRLTNLRSLDLSLNALTGAIPEALRNLRSLQELYLSGNQLISPIPNFHSQLSKLRLNHNQLNGSIPKSLGRLTALTEIFLNSNRFTGPIPVFLGRLTSLRVFSLSSNLLNGTIPNSIGKLTKLNVLDVSNNFIQGVVSEDHFANLSLLKYLDANSNNELLFNISHEWIPPFQLKVIQLGSCKIGDKFPQWLRTQMNLEMLVLSNASISGPLPTWLRLMPVISALDLSYNKLTGPLSNLPSVYDGRYEFYGELFLQNNHFSGLIPSRLCRRTYLEILDLSRNRLSGKIPKCVWNLPLMVMLLSSNKLSGVIPSPLGYPSLQWLQLNDNNFSGELPREYGYFVNLTVLDLGENQISGNIPNWIGEKLSLLSALRLHKNNFTGRIPHSLCKSGLQILDLAHNNLTGSIPHCFGELSGMKGKSAVNYMIIYLPLSVYSNMMQVLKGVALNYTSTLKYVTNIDLSSNKLVGEIPEALTTLDALMGLNLCNNHFSRGIPKNIGNMKSLISLDLSANELTGTIPLSIAALNFLSYLNLSHNNLSGQIPTGNQLQTLTDPSMYSDNTYLCGKPLPKECSPHENTTSNNIYKNANEPKKVWFYLDIMSGFATGFWGIIGVLFFKKQWRRKLFMYSEIAMDKIYVAVAVRVLKMKRGRGREAA
ncbi:receptor-like protein EIX2 [Helianthus annuus]|uniref:receptor-like protein EIX2 n=1 Tax=Helianthus annuus TaxID=4232 RepID=UPI000B8F84B2|nr:receptor-like protein EIX2 [Helianthus annuus]